MNALELTALALMVLLTSSSPALAEEGRTEVVQPPQTGPAFDRERTVYTIDRETLEAEQIDDGVAAAALAPGVALQRTNRGAGAPLIRGFIGPQNLVIVDDVRFDLSTFRTGPNQYAALAEPDGFDMVEVTLGPGSVLWGSGAMGGVLRYHTAGLREEDGVGGRALSRLTSADGAFGGTLQLDGRSGSVAGWLGGSIRHHGTLRTGGGGQAPMSEFDAGSWRGKLGVDLGDGWNLSSAYLAHLVRDAGRTDKLGRGEVRLYDNDDHLAYVQVGRVARGGWLRDLRLTLSFHHLEDVVTRFNCERNPDGSPVDRAACVARLDETVTRIRENTDHVNAVGLRASAEMRWLDEQLVLRTGLDGRFEQVGSAAEDSTSSSVPRGTFSDGSSYGGADAFALLEGRPYVDPGTFELVLTGGARLSTVFASASDVPGLGQVDYTLVSPSFSAGMRALVANQLNVFMSFHEGVRAPNLQETTALGDTGNFFEVPNAELGPERADSIETGVRLHLGWLRLEGVYFHTWLADAIVREEVEGGAEAFPEAGDATVMRRVNAEQAVLDGVEVGFATGALYGMSLFGDVAWIESEVTRVDGTTEPGRRTPPVQGRAGVRWSGTPYLARLALGVRWAAAQTRLSSGDRKDLRICEDPTQPGVSLGDACDGTPGWAALDLKAGISLHPGFRIEASVNNLLDTPIRHHGSGFDEPGVDVRFALSQTF